MMMVDALVLMIMQGIRWWILLLAFIPALRLFEALDYHFRATFYSIVLPTSAAQDVVRAAIFAKRYDYAVGAGAAWVTRLFGLLVLAGMSAISLLLLQSQTIPIQARFSIIVIFVVSGLLLAISFSKKLTRPIRFALTKLFPKKLMQITQRIRDGVYAYRDRKKNLFTALVVTLLTQIFAILNAALVIRGITGEWYIVEVFAFVPIIEIICISLPFTPNGWGVREGLSALMFRYMGRSEEEVLIYAALSSATLLLKIFGGLPIAAETIKSRMRIKSPPKA